MSKRLLRKIRIFIRHHLVTRLASITRFSLFPRRFPATRPGLIATFSLPFLLAACTPTTHFVLQGGEQADRPVIRRHRPGPYLLIFALDGVGREQMTAALQSGATPWLSALLGARQSEEVFEHAYSVPRTVSVLPSTTIPGWSSVFTGRRPAYNGIPGNEWFVREERRFLAPIPVSSDETDDARRAVADDLVGKVLKGPTLFDELSGPAFVSLNDVHRGADIFTTNSPAEIGVLAMAFKAGNFIKSIPMLQKSYEELDRNSVPKVIEAIKQHGVPTLQVVYFPGTDLYTHLAENPLDDQIRYLETITFPLIETVLGEYRRQSALEDTYVIFISDHGHTPVLMDSRHALAAEPDMRAPGLLQSLGFRVRPSELEVAGRDADYQAVLAYQGAMAYAYLADRSTCPKPGQSCDWSKAPRFEQDVMPVARAFYRANRAGDLFPHLKGTLDLVLAREPAPLAQNAHEYEIYDGSRLVPIREYLRQHPRPDLVQLDRRMRWLSEGPYGHRAGDVLLMAKSGLERPLAERFYFSAPYHAQHGSASAQDSYITFIVARQNFVGKSLQKIVDKILGDEPSQLDIAPLLLTLLKGQKSLSDTPQSPPENGPIDARRRLP